MSTYRIKDELEVEYHEGLMDGALNDGRFKSFAKLVWLGLA